MTAQNPFVDGITNLAIPDSPRGVDLRRHDLKGNLYAQQAHIGDAYLDKMHIGGAAYLKGLGVQGSFHFSGASIAQSLFMQDVVITGDAYLDNILVGSALELARSQMQHLYLANARIHGAAHMTEIVTQQGAYLGMCVEDMLFLGIKTKGLSLYGLEVKRTAYLLGIEAISMNMEHAVTHQKPFVCHDRIVLANATIKHFTGAAGSILAPVVEVDKKSVDIPRGLQIVLQEAPKLYAQAFPVAQARSA